MAKYDPEEPLSVTLPSGDKILLTDHINNTIKAGCTIGDPMALALKDVRAIEVCPSVYDVPLLFVTCICTCGCQKSWSTIMSPHHINGAFVTLPLFIGRLAHQHQLEYDARAYEEITGEARDELFDAACPFTDDEDDDEQDSVPRTRDGSPIS